MKDVIIVDNSPVAFMFQPENAIPCISWYDDMNDTQLDRIATILEKLAYEDDVRKIIRKIIKNNEIDDRAEQIYLQAHKREHSQKQAESRSNVNMEKKADQVNSKQHHQRYESADNKQRHQAIIQEKMRANQLDEQFNMTDQNLDQILKQIKVQRDNYVDESRGNYTAQ